MSDIAQEETTEIALDAHAEAGPFQGDKAAASDVIRIEHTLHVTWSGVSGCCSGGRPQREVTKDFQQWVGQQITANPGKPYLRSGHGGGTARCRSSQAPWPDNSRSCSGSASVVAFIEFLKA